VFKFGTLFAASSNTSQAVLTSSPSGSHTISELGNSLFGLFCAFQPGVLNVVINGGFPITQNFGETTHVINIGATPTTEPLASEQIYQARVYSVTFAITASHQMEQGNTAKRRASKASLVFDNSMLVGNDNHCCRTTAH
jgi:hypothetical protein